MNKIHGGSGEVRTRGVMSYSRQYFVHCGSFEEARRSVLFFLLLHVFASLQTSVLFPSPDPRKITRMLDWLSSWNLNLGFTIYFFCSSHPLAWAYNTPHNERRIYKQCSYCELQHAPEFVGVGIESW